jgi:hypothetical protein
MLPIGFIDPLISLNVLVTKRLAETGTFGTELEPAILIILDMRLTVRTRSFITPLHDITQGLTNSN